MDPIERRNRWQYDRGNEVDIDRLLTILKYYEGRHNFICFSGALERNERRSGVVKTTTRTVTKVRLVCEEDDNKISEQKLYRIDIYLEGALYKMVRNMVSTALDVSRGWLEEEVFLDMLHRPEELKLSRKDNPCMPAPPHGLTLERVYYPDDCDMKF